MREIKFRAYFEPIIENGEVIYEGFIDNVLKLDTSDMSIMTSAYCNNPNENMFMFLTGTDTRWHNQQHRQFHIMQYTGLKDMNGIEIYDGDIVVDTAEDEIGKIYWNDAKSMFVYTALLEDGDFEELYEYINDLVGSFKVIGNVYENPELLDV